MNVNFTENDLDKLNEMIQATPFKYAYPLFQFFQGKISESVKAQQEAKQALSIPPTNEADGN